MSPNKNKTKHPKSIVKSKKIPKIYFRSEGSNIYVKRDCSVIGKKTLS